MNRLLILIFIFLVNIFNSQEEKRLALVIGNANYDKGALKNPVNDAALIKQTLEDLNFDVIYATNLESKRSMVDKIAEFGRKRGDFEVNLVYYAGHGVQVAGENYLLPTKEIFESEYDVEDYGVSVQKIMRYLNGTNQKLNVLILDACRDNPFEENWNNSRSIKGSGLAKIPPPTGSLIAFSTSANKTATDGVGVNSFYCKSLSNNLKLENTSIDQVFRNVRSDVIKATNGRQTPEEVSKLVGDAFYLTKIENTKTVSLDDKLKTSFSKLYNFENYTKSLELSIIHVDDSNSKNIIKIWEEFNSAINYTKNRNEDLYIIALIGQVRSSMLAWMVSSGYIDLSQANKNIILKNFLKSSIELKKILTNSDEEKIKEILNNHSYIGLSFNDLLFRVKILTFFAATANLMTYDDVDEIDDDLKLISLLNSISNNYESLNPSQKLIFRHINTIFSGFYPYFVEEGYQKIESELPLNYFKITQKNRDFLLKAKNILGKTDFHFYSKIYGNYFKKASSTRYYNISGVLSEVDYLYNLYIKNGLIEHESYDYSYGSFAVSYYRAHLNPIIEITKRLKSFISYKNYLEEDKTLLQVLDSTAIKLNIIVDKFVSKNLNKITSETSNTDYFELEIFENCFDELLEINDFVISKPLKKEFNVKIHNFLINLYENRITYAKKISINNFDSTFTRNDFIESYLFDKYKHISDLFKTLSSYRLYSNDKLTDSLINKTKNELVDYWELKILNNNRADTINDETFSNYFYFKSICCDLDYEDDLYDKIDCYHSLVKSMSNYDFAIEKQNNPPLISEIWTNYSSSLRNSKCKDQNDNICNIKFHKNYINYSKERIDYFKRVWGSYNNGNSFQSLGWLSNYYLNNLSNSKNYNYDFLSIFSKMTDSFLGLILHTKNNIHNLEKINNSNFKKINIYFEVLNKILNNNNYNIDFKETIFNLNIKQVKDFLNENKFPPLMDLIVEKINSKVKIHENIFNKIKEDIELFKKVNKGIMGFRSENITDLNEQKKFGKVRVIEVMENYPAFLAGIKVGDYILKINEVDIYDYYDIIDLGSLTNPNDEVEILINRKGKSKRIIFNVN